MTVTNVRTAAGIGQFAADGVPGRQIRSQVCRTGAQWSAVAKVGIHHAEFDWLHTVSYAHQMNSSARNDLLDRAIGQSNRSRIQVVVMTEPNSPSAQMRTPRRIARLQLDHSASAPRRTSGG